MPQPQSTEFFLILIAVFGALVWWLIVAKQLVFRVLAACLAFIPAMMFGVATVNKYYDYYQNWHAAISDLTNQGVQAAVNVPNAAAQPGVKFGTFLGQTIDTGLAAQQGFTLRLTVPGQASHLSRAAYVYLPPQYFQAAYARYRFPVIELIHGFPGTPQDWITVLSVNLTMNSMVTQGLAKPAVLVMPDANGTRGVSLQCLNQWHGPQDDTYLARDLPNFIASSLRVQPPGSGWAIAGYSEGGFCAANLGLQHGRTFTYAGVLSGYFKPTRNQLLHPTRMVSPFGSRAQELQNTPLDLLQSLPARQPIAQFWIGAGALNVSAVRDSQSFRQLLQLREPVVPFSVVRGGHTMFTWRILLPQMLAWMTPRLATEAAAADARAARQQRVPATAGGAPQRHGA
ncbi:MAG TPA: alpha/beta hydrolase-fold protein [Streptosporangiaceae bacterium]